jgi:hypothetical protein
MVAASRLRFSPLLIAATAATLLGAWLRIHGLTTQVVIDDEWHAIHKLAESSYADIFSTFGYADHSIPLTLLYKLMADTIGLAEGRMRALQVACGIALVPLCAWAAWRATRDAAAAALLAVLLAGAPFLVLWSRFARPYSITLLLDVAAIVALCAWRSRRTWPMASVAVASAAIATWFHPLSGLPPALACIVIFVQDVARPGARPRQAWGSLGIGVAMLIAMLALIAVPAWNDWQSLQAKAGGDHPGAETVVGVLSLFLGGVPVPVMCAAVAVALFGAASFYRREPAIAVLVLVVALVPPVLISVLGAAWSHMAGTFARYILVSQPILLFLLAYGAISLVRIAARSHAQRAAWAAMLSLSLAYLAATPAIAQVARLGPWYGHQDYHWDYRYRWNVSKRSLPDYAPPAFYLGLGKLPPGDAPIIEAPFVYEAPFNPLDVYATYHHQPEKLGVLRGLCVQGAPMGTTAPRDRRFRFRMFVSLEDTDAVRNSPARFIVLHRQFPMRPPFPQYDACRDALAMRYGAPALEDSRVAVFDLARWRRTLKEKNR